MHGGRIGGFGAVNFSADKSPELDSAAGAYEAGLGAFGPDTLLMSLCLG